MQCILYLRVVLNNPYIILINKKKTHFIFFISPNMWVKNESHMYVYAAIGSKQTS